MTAPICVNCQVTMICVKQGQVIELMTDQSEYQLWSSDLWQCKGCQTRIISGFGSQPLAEAYQPTYKAQQKLFQPLIQFWQTWNERVSHRCRYASRADVICDNCGASIHLVEGYWSHVNIDEFTQCKNNWSARYGNSVYMVRPRHR